MSAVPKPEVSSDFITVLTCYNKLHLTKIYTASGIASYDDAKQFAVTTIQLTCLRDISKVLIDLSGKPHKAAIRGGFVGEAKAVEILPPKKPGMFMRRMALFPDVAHHWVQFDIDKFKVEDFDPVLEPVRAIDLFISKKLPTEFHGVSYHWNLTSSAGMAPGVLKARVTFWLATPYSSEHLKAWAESADLGVDKSLFHPIQLHYTAAPLFKDGTVDPVPVRYGFEEGLLGDEVELNLDPLCVLKPDAVVRGLNKEMPNACEKPGWIGAFCRAYTAADVVDQYLTEVFEWQITGSGTGEKRLNFLLSASGAAGGAFVTDDGYHIANKHDSDPFGNRAANSFDLVRQYKFGHLDSEQQAKDAVTSRPSYKAMVAWCQTIEAVKLAAAAEGMAAAGALFEDLGAGDDDATPAKDWRLSLEMDNNARLVVTMSNIRLCLLNLMPGLYYDQFKQRLMTETRWPWRDGKEWRGDSDLAGLRHWLEGTMRWAGNLNSDILFQTLLTIEHERGRHPIREWFKTLRWDGVQRVDTLLIRAAGAPDTFFVREAMRKALVAAVARILEPGTKFDYVLTLIGEQGIRKSSFFRALAGDSWFADDAPSMTAGDGKAFKEYLGSGKWIVELAEMTATKRADHEHVKAMLTAQTDSYRPAYGRFVREVPRQCILVATTNDPTPYRDRTGNRRAWPVEIKGAINTKLVEAERGQLFAEAIVMWEQGEELFLSPEAEIEATEWAKEFTNDAGLAEAAEIIRDWLDGYTDEFGEVQPPVNQVCALQIARECRGLQVFTNWPDKRALAREAMPLVIKMGDWEKYPFAFKTKSYGSQKGWKRKGTWEHRSSYRGNSEE
jgi:putative DNA primase/helicase